MKKRIDAFGHAWSGIYWGVKREVHLKVHLCAFVLVVLGGFYLELGAGEWLAVLICSALVVSLELMNTAIEKICDLITRERREEIGYIKDVAAGAVLVSALVSVVVALIIIWQHLNFIAVA